MKRRKPSVHRAARMKVVYISGPYTAATEDAKQANINSARMAAQFIWGKGHAVICPHLNTKDMELCALSPSVQYTTWLEGDFAILSRCDCVVMLPGWERSYGARQEAMFAMQQKKPILYWPCVEAIWTKQSGKRSSN